MNRTDILNATINVTSNDRLTDYETPEDSFSTIADYWNVRLRHKGLLAVGKELNATEVGMLLMLMKVARQEVSPSKADHYVDMAGYAACTGEISTTFVQQEFDFNEFPDPPPGKKWHNPQRLTPQQVQIQDGWRLCLTDEVADLPDQYLEEGVWYDADPAPDSIYAQSDLTYRTKAPLPWTNPTL